MITAKHTKYPKAGERSDGRILKLCSSAMGLWMGDGIEGPALLIRTKPRNASQNLGWLREFIVERLLNLSILWPTEHTDDTEKNSGSAPWIDSVERRAELPGGRGLKRKRVTARPEARLYLRSQPWQEPVGLGLR
jgi:hypothetical protein